MGDIETLGFVLGKVGNFNLDTFNSRLIFQKTVYLLEAFGINIGYDYSWYLRGPYTSHLSSDGFAVRDKYGYDRLPQDLRFADEIVRKRFEEYLEFMADKKHDHMKLEILASIHFLKKEYPSKSNEEIFQILRNTASKANITLEQVNNAVQELKDHNLL